MYVCVCVYIYIYMYVCVYIYIYIYIYILGSVFSRIVIYSSVIREQREALS